VIRRGLLLVLLWMAATGCHGPSPRDGLDQATSRRHERVARVGESLLPGVAMRWSVTPRRDLGAWAWPDGRIEVSRALVDRLDDDELRAAIAHELGHLIDRGHLHGAPKALAGEAADLERRADRIACTLLCNGGVPVDAMGRMLGTIAAATRDPGGGLAARIAALPADCADLVG
jgi:predicted Zn-dependent protease